MQWGIDATALHPNLILIGNTNAVVQLKAGEEATFSPDGMLLSQKMMSKDRFSQLIIETMSGQNLLPESHAINLVYQQLYGVPDSTLLSILGSDWLIAARTPYPRLRGANNLVVPNNKLPKEEEETAKTYVCSTSGNSFQYFQSGNESGVSNITDATKFQTTESNTTGSCSGKLAGSSGMETTSPEFI